MNFLLIGVNRFLTVDWHMYINLYLNIYYSRDRKWNRFINCVCYYVLVKHWIYIKKFFYESSPSLSLSVQWTVYKIYSFEVYIISSKDRIYKSQLFMNHWWCQCNKNWFLDFQTRRQMIPFLKNQHILAEDAVVFINTTSFI